jgi:3-hydroxybutyryl-CoA dehydrogenase
MKSIETLDPVMIIGAGVMGSGIAQVAAQAGHRVMLFDAQPAVATAAKTGLESTLEKLVARGKFSSAEAAAILSRIEPVESLSSKRSSRTSQ